jgi:vancomycin resistance protein YoaR
VQSFANPAMSGPVALELGGQLVRLQPRDFAAALSMRAVDGELAPHVRAGLLVSLVHQAMAGHGAAADARVALVSGRPRVLPARVGVSFEPASAVAAFTAALALPEGQRVAPVEVELHQPAITTDDAKALGVDHRVAVYATSYAAHDAGPDLARAVHALDGRLLMPGDTFSWTAVAGSGYGASAVPVATALYNTAFDAGFGDVEHHSPVTYAGRSPVGREATVEGGADLRFSVDSPYGVLVQARLTGASAGRPGTVKVVLWSTAAWEVTSATSGRYDLVEPGTREDSGPGCAPSPGKRGFDVDVTRHLRSLTDPASDRDETVHTTYAPVDAVVCVDAPSAAGRGATRSRHENPWYQPTA